MLTCEINTDLMINFLITLRRYDIVGDHFLKLINNNYIISKKISLFLWVLLTWLSRACFYLCVGGVFPTKSNFTACLVIHVVIYISHEPKDVACSLQNYDLNHPKDIFLFFKLSVAALNNNAAKSKPHICCCMPTILLF